MNIWMAAGVDAMATGQLNLVTDTIKAVLVDSASYTFSTAHTSLANVPAGARKGTFTLSGKTFSGKVFDANDGFFPAVAAGGPYEYIYLYKETGVEANNTLVLFIDTSPDLPVTGNNNDILCEWSNASDRIGRLG